MVITLSINDIVVTMLMTTMTKMRDKQGYSIDPELYTPATTTLKLNPETLHASTAKASPKPCTLKATTQIPPS